FVHTEEVTGSIPVSRTPRKRTCGSGCAFFVFTHRLGWTRKSTDTAPALVVPVSTMSCREVCRRGDVTRGTRRSRKSSRAQLCCARLIDHRRKGDGDMTSATTDSVLELQAEAQNLLFREARTANTFSSEPVTDEQLRAIYDLVKWAPTSMNNQPLRALVVRTDD